jgi:PIN domain nuclease of toxin-antitoxin system
MSSVVLDASAVLALVFAEPGAELVAGRLPHSLLSAVNYAEVLTRSVDRGRDLDDTIAQVRRLQIAVWPCDAEQAAIVASLRAVTRPYGLSLADRCCLALGLNRRAPVLTADRDWRKLKLDLDIVLIR